MYSSSGDLLRGLSRTLSLLALDPLADERVPWWSRLPVSVQTRARAGTLGFEELTELLLARPQLEAINRVRRRLDIAPLERDDLYAHVRRAIISGRAHASHQGRDVYGASNKELWDLVVGPLGQAVYARWGAIASDRPMVEPGSRTPPAAVRELAETLVAFRTGPRDHDHERCASWLHQQLTALGFSVALHRRDGAPPVIEAHRPARALAGHVVLYGHYDTVNANAKRWASDPDQLVEREGRWYARGIADNKGPLATRLWALSKIERAPALTWLIQGEEETGSRWSRDVLGRVVPSVRADLWLDETGYHDHEDGTLRLLARGIGEEPDSARAPDELLGRVLDGLRVLAASVGLATRAELRGLNKAVVAGGCPFNRSLPPGARYLALGVNDTRARIHAHDESIPTWPIPLHRDELALVFDTLDREVRRG